MQRLLLRAQESLISSRLAAAVAVVHSLAVVVVVALCKPQLN